MSGEAEPLPPPPVRPVPDQNPIIADNDGSSGDVSGATMSMKRKSSGPDADDDDGTKRLKTNEGLASVVAKHYNELEEKGVEARSESRIFYMRNFNNWTKSMLINEAVQRLRAKHIDRLNILDICCGKGGDILKWLKTNMAEHVVFADIASTSVDQCKERYDKAVGQQKNQRYSNRNEKLFTAEFIAADCTKERLRDKYQNQNLSFDLVSCQFSFHYCFESYAQAKTMLQNISENLKVGGLFIGTIPNASRIVRLVRSSDGKLFGNSVFRIDFDSEESFPMFGAKYYFRLEEVVNCPEFLVHFLTLEKLARLFRLRLIFKYTFDEFFQQKEEDGRFLMERMQALETFPSDDSKDGHNHAEQFSQAEKQYEQDMKRQNHFRIKYGTLSKSEWEAVTLYVVFGFEKM